MAIKIQYTMTPCKINCDTYSPKIITSNIVFNKMVERVVLQAQKWFTLKFNMLYQDIYNLENYNFKIANGIFFPKRIIKMPWFTNKNIPKQMYISKKHKFKMHITTLIALSHQ